MLYMVTWTPSIYPSFVSLYAIHTDPSWVIQECYFSQVRSPIGNRHATWPGTVKSWRKRPDPDGVDVEMPLGAPGMKWLCHVLFFFYICF